MNIGHQCNDCLLSRVQCPIYAFLADAELIDDEWEQHGRMNGFLDEMGACKMKAKIERAENQDKGTIWSSYRTRISEYEIMPSMRDWARKRNLI